MSRLTVPALLEPKSVSFRAFLQQLTDSVNGFAPGNASYIVRTTDPTLTNEQALGDLASGIVMNTTTTGVLSIATEGTDYYLPGGTDVRLEDGGTGTSLTAPGTDSIMFYDVSSTAANWLTLGTGLTITGTTLDLGVGAYDAIKRSWMGI